MKELQQESLIKFLEKLRDGILEKVPVEAPGEICEEIHENLFKKKSQRSTSTNS